MNSLQRLKDRKPFHLLLSAIPLFATINIIYHSISSFLYHHHHHHHHHKAKAGKAYGWEGLWPQGLVASRFAPPALSSGR